MIISKNIKDVCDNHYIITQKDGNVIVYYENKEAQNNKTFRQTQISTQYLTKVDQESLTKGIKVKGEDKVNEVLES